MRGKNQNIRLWVFQLSLLLSVTKTAQCDWLLLHYGSLYSHSDVPQVQTVFGHLAHRKAHRLKLKHGKQLLPGVDDLALHTP